MLQTKQKNVKRVEQYTTSIVNNGTKNMLGTRVQEHLSRNSSAIHEHCKLTGHSVDSNKTKVLDTESNAFKRRIREAIEIRLRKPSLDRDSGFN